MDEIYATMLNVALNLGNHVKRVMLNGRSSLPTFASGFEGNFERLIDNK